MGLCKVLWPLFLDTFKKEVRSKSVLLFVAVMAMMAAIGIFLKGFFSEGADQFYSFLQSICLRNVPFLVGIFFAAAVGSSTLRSDLKTSVAMQIAAFPLPAWAYVATRVVGAWAVVMIYELLFVGGLLLLSWSIFPEMVWNDMQTNFHFAWVSGVSFGGIYLLGVVLVAAVLAMYVKELVALVLVFVFYVVTLLAGYGNLITQDIGVSAKSILGTLLSLVFPPLAWWNGLADQAFEEKVAALNVAEAAYLIWSLIIIAGWIWILSRLLRRQNYQV